MPAAIATAMPALQEKRGGENRSAKLIEIIVLGLDQLPFLAGRRRFAEPQQAIPAQTRALRTRLSQLMLHFDGNGECLAPAWPLERAAVGEATRILLPAHRTQLFSR